MTYSFAVIGDGPGATSYLQQFILLFKQAKSYGCNIDSSQIELTALGRHKEEEAGAGTPYCQKFNNYQYLNNVPPTIMSCRYVTDPDAIELKPNLDFCRWYRENYSRLDEWFPGLKQAHPTLDISPDATFRNPQGDLNDPTNVRRKFVLPRVIYGKYLHQRYSEALDEAEKMGMHVKRLHESNVTDINDDFPDKQRIVYSDKEGQAHTIEVDQSVLLTGHTLGRRFKDALSPYMPREDFAARVDKDKADHHVTHAAILGTSLGGIDGVMGILTRYGHWENQQGEAVFVWDGDQRITIDMCSRHGMLPKVRGEKSSRPNEFFNDDMHESCPTLADLFSRLDKELQNVYGRPIDWENVMHPKDDVLTRLKKDIQVSRDGDVEGGYQGWESVFLSVDFDKVFNGLREDQQRLFMEKYKSVFDTYGAPMPAYNAQRLQHLIEQGILRVRELGEDTKVDIAEGGHASIQGKDGVVEYNYAVDATNQVSDITKAPGLLSKLAETALLHPVTGSARIHAASHDLLKPVRIQTNYPQVSVEINIPEAASRSLAYGAHVIGDAFWSASVIDGATHGIGMAYSVLGDIAHNQGTRLPSELGQAYPEAEDFFEKHVVRRGFTDLYRGADSSGVTV